MPSQTAIVGSAKGLHAGPAGIIAEAAEKYETEIELGFGTEEADAASDTLIVALGADKGDVITVNGENADAVAEIASLIEQDHDAQ